MPDIPQPPHPVVALRAAILACGLQPVAVATRGKRPWGEGQFGENWQNTKGQPPFLAAAQNTGILCDRVRGIDGDIDDPEAAETARRIVLDILGPSTVIRTRADSARFLIVYRGVGRKRVIKTDAGKVEILGQGQQFVAYGVHPDGAEFEWLEDEPAAKRLNGRVVEEADLDRLETALHAALGGAPVEQEPPVIKQSFTTGAGSGANEWARAALEREVDAVASAPKGTRNHTLNIAAFNLGQIVAGGPLSRSEVEARLTQAALGIGLTAPETRATIRSGLGSGAREPRRAPERTIEVPPTVVEAAAAMASTVSRPRAKAADPLTALAPGVDWRTPRGLIGQISDWILETSRWPNRPLAVAAGTVVMSALCGRWLYAPTGTALNVYVVGLGKTGVGKDRPLSGVAQVLAAAGVPALKQTAKTFSVSGCENLVRDNPCCVATTDEIGVNLLARIANKHASHESGDGIKGILLELWSREYGKEGFPTTRRAQAASQTIASPSLTLFGMSTPEAFYETFRAGDAMSGFLNRFLIAAADRSPTDPNDAPFNPPPSTLVETIRAMIPEQDGNIGDVMGVYRAPSVIERRMRWADEATKREALGLEKGTRAIAADHRRGELMARTFEYSVRLAALHAMSQTRWTVDRADLAWGASWAIGSTQAMIAAADDLMAETPYQRTFNEISKIIREASTIGKSALLRACRTVSARELAAILDHLAGAETIEVIEVETGKAGRRPQVYRWVG